MSAHTKIRKTFHLMAGSYAEVTVNLHMVDPLDANPMIDRILKVTEDVCQDYRLLFENREKARLAPPAIKTPSIPVERVPVVEVAKAVEATPIDRVDVEEIPPEVEDVEPTSRGSRKKL